MPYVKKEKREYLDDVVELMKKVDIQADGDLNYILFKYCKYNVKPSYNNLKNFCGELRQCATEIERTILATYEDKKIIENGEIW